MAEENVIKTNIVATSNMSGLISDLNKVTTSLANLQQQLNATNKQLAYSAASMSKQFADTLRSTGQFSTHFVSLTSDVDKFGQQLDKGQLKLGQFFNIYKQHVQSSGGLIRQLAQQQVQLQNAILQPLGKNAQGLMQYNVHIPTGLDKVKNSAALARQELGIMNKVIQEGAGQLINWGKNTQWAGRQLTVGLTVPLAAFGKAAADAFRMADQELVRLTKVYGGLSATSSAELMKVRKDVTATATELSKQYGASFKDTLALAADIAATGKQGNELLGSIKETTRLSVLGEVDRQEAMKATLAIQTAFKQNTEELTNSINFLNAVENQTSTTLQDLVEAIPKAGPIIKGLGGNVQDLALYLTAMREGGVSAAEGANALKSALGSLINPTKVATNMFAGFGIDLKKIVTANAGNLTGTILELQKALDTLNPLQKQQALEQLFGKFQFARMNALFSNLGKQGSQTLQVLDLMKASSTDLANIAGRELSQVTESASGKYRRALEGLKADLATVGDSFLKINTTLINVVDNVLKFVQHLPGPIKSLLSFFGMLTAAAGPLIMLTGVLGNFFGYIIKGISHFRSFFKGAEGWKLLTPEILAANKASNLVEQSMYSDARAAAVLNQALQPLIASYARLTQQMEAGVIHTNPTFVTPAGTVATPGRQVNPNSPYLTPIDTRHFAHMNPVSMMTNAEKAQQSIFGVVPGPQTVNQRIGKTPQLYMTEELPRIQGVTAVGKVSTGVVAGEAAKFHAMTGAMGMQTQAEIAKLRTEVARTGLITDELAQAYDALLPQMQDITSNAATRTRQIVGELQANKITADQARAQIIALNREIETMMIGAAEQTAAQLGRNVNVTQLPLLNQPAFDPRTGKANMKELFREKRGTRALLNNIARILGVKTYGASYSVETTIPKRLNAGGQVTGSRGNYGNVYDPSQHGAVVPGPNVNYDIIPSNVPVGGFVLNQAASRANPDLVNLAVRGYNSGGQMTPAVLTPGETVVDPFTYISNKEAFDRANATRMSLGGGINASRMNYGTRLRDVIKLVGGMRARGSNAQGFISQILGMEESATKQKYLQVAEQYINKQTRSRSNFLTYSQTSKTLNEKNIPYLNREFEMAGLTPLPYSTPRNLTHWTVSDLLGNGSMISDYMVLYSRTSNLQANRNRLRPIDLIYRDLVKLPGMNKYEAQLRAARIPKDKWDEAEVAIDSAIRQHFETEAARRGVDLKDLPYIGDRPETGVTYTFLNDLMPQLESALEKISPNSTKLDSYRALKENTQFRPTSNRKSRTFNGGGLIPGYVGGGVLSKAGVLKKLGALFSVNEGGRGYTVNALPRRLNLKAFDMLPISLKAKKFLYDALVTDVTRRSPKSMGSVQYGPLTPYGRASKTVKGFGGKDRDDIWQSVSALLKDNPNLSDYDRAYFTKVNSNYQQMPWYIARGLGMNLGGIIGGRISRTRRNYGVTPIQGMPGFGQQNAAWGGHEILQNSIPQRGGMLRAYGPSMVGNTLGWMLGSSLTGGNMLGGIAGSMAGDFAATALMSKFSSSATGATKSASLFRTALQGLINLPGPVKIVAAVAALGLAIKSVNDKIQEHRKIINQGFAPTADTVSKLNLRFVSLKDTLDQAKARIDAIRESSGKLYATRASAGIPGLTLTIQQLKDLKESVKKDFPDLIEIFNKAKPGEILGKAEQLKAQFVAGGMSAQQATNIIYTLISQSNDANLALKAIGSQGFMAIKDGATAATSSIKTFLGLLATNNVDQIASSLDSVVNALTNAESKLIGTKDNQGNIIDQGRAFRDTIDKIKTLSGQQGNLNTQQLNSLKSQNAVLALILGNAETLSSVYSKIKLYTMGINVNLSNLNSTQAETLAKVLTATENSLKTTTFKKITDEINKQTKATKANSASVMASIEKQKSAIQDQIDLRQKEIDLIKKTADERRNALDQEISDSNYLIEIKKKQLDYQEALASGDFAAAARAQLDIQQLTGQQQVDLAKRAITDKENKDVAAKQLEIEKLQNQIKNLDKQVMAANKTAADAIDKVDKLQALLNGAITAIFMAFDKKITEEERTYINDIRDQLSKDKRFKDLAPLLNPYSPRPGGTSPLQDLLNQQLKEGTKVSVINWEDFKTQVWDKIVADTGAKIKTPAQQAYEKAPVPLTNGPFSTPPTSPKPGTTETQIESGRVVTYIYDLDGKKYPIDSPYGKSVKKRYGKAQGGYIKHYGPGGDVMGPGTATSDSIPAYLSNGEYVIRASSVNKYGKELFDGLNAQKFAGGGKASVAPHDWAMRQGVPKSQISRSNKLDAPYNRFLDPVLNKTIPILARMSPENDLLNAIARPFTGKKDSGTKFMESFIREGVKPLREIALGSATKGDWINAALLGFPSSKTVARGTSFISKYLAGWKMGWNTFTPESSLLKHLIGGAYGLKAARRGEEWINTNWMPWLPKSMLEKIKYQYKYGEPYDVTDPWNAPAGLKLWEPRPGSALERKLPGPENFVKNKLGWIHSLNPSTIKKSIFNSTLYGALGAKHIMEQSLPASIEGIKNPAFKSLFETYFSRHRSAEPITQNIHPLNVPVKIGRTRGPGTYAAITSGMSKTNYDFGNNIYRMALTPGMIVKLLTSKGYIHGTEELNSLITKFNLKTGNNLPLESGASSGVAGGLSGLSWDSPLVQWLLKEGYVGYRHGMGEQALTNWLIGVSKSFKLKPTNFAAGGFISPRYNVPTPATAMVNPMTMRYNNGGSVHRYDVGGLVLNPPPGTDNREIASMVVSMLEGKNIMNAAKSGNRGRT